METLAAMVLMTGAVPLVVAWRATDGSTIRPALVWAGLAWIAWLGAAMVPHTLSSYAALTLTAGAGVAVLGARRPVVGAWNFIVGSLLVVFWMAWAEGLLYRPYAADSSGMCWLITVLFGFGLLLSAQIHRGVDIPRSASALL